MKRSIRIALITVAAAWIALSYKVSGIAHSNETEYWYAAALAKLDCIDGSMPPLRRVFASDGRTK